MKEVVGHSYSADQNKMVLYFKNGGLQEIADWKNHEVKLGVDWVLAMKKNMEAKTGQGIPLAVDTSRN
jgi:hypothetical protein